MAYIGYEPAKVPLTSADITDGIITNADIATTAAIATSKLGTGAVLQVVTANYSTITSLSSATYADTGLTASITPTSSSNKILVLISQNGLNCNTASNGINLKLVRGATDLLVFAVANCYVASAITSASSSYLDSPSTTSSTTYKTQQARFSGAGQVQTQANNDNSTITLIEIKA